MTMFFLRWTEEFRPDVVERSYRLGALPVLAWEPWAGAGKGASQPTYALSRIINGSFDPYVTRTATAIRNMRWPVAIRFAHEMNGNWYPWSERQHYNRNGEYARAWRHVHDIFRKVGATDVIWIWSPNILRPVPDVSLDALYPGDRYVDWLGMVGYAGAERTAPPVFAPTLEVLRKISDKPVIITETGARPGPGKIGWITDFFRWLSRQPDVAGFIWFEYSAREGGNADWRFTATSQTERAFRSGLSGVTLAPPPTG